MGTLLSRELLRGISEPEVVQNFGIEPRIINPEAQAASISGILAPVAVYAPRLEPPSQDHMTFSGVPQKVLKPS